MSLAERLWCAHADIAAACLRHPFVRALCDGSLARDRYRRFIAQDAFFLDAFARGYATGVARAPDRDSMRRFHALQCGVFEEQRLHEAAARALGIDLAAVEPLAATRDYAALLASVGERPLGELLAAMAPCMRLYGWLGQRLAGEGPAPAYAEWVATYAADGYQRLVAEIERLLDRFGEETPAERSVYGRAMALEQRFFDMAWESEE